MPELYRHVLLAGGDGNPFTRIRAAWFVELAAEKLREVLADPPAPKYQGQQMPRTLHNY